MLLHKAAAFAAKKHAGQLRKYTHDPYIVHPTAVALAVAAAGGDEAQIAAAFLHDTLEDTDTTHAELVTEFGQDVADLVLELTDVFTHEAFPHLNRAARKMLETDRIATISDRAKAVKKADIADNTSSIVTHDPDFAKVYLVEKAAVMAVL
jgi:(p)ppGpp synthase/HD superfamily hydrolase